MFKAEFRRNRGFRFRFHDKNLITQRIYNIASSFLYLQVFGCVSELTSERAPGLEAFGDAERMRVQGYLAHKKPSPHGTLQWTHAYGPMVVLGGVAVSYERGTPAPMARSTTLVPFAGQFTT